MHCKTLAGAIKVRLFVRESNCNTEPERWQHRCRGRSVGCERSLELLWFVSNCFSLAPK